VAVVWDPCVAAALKSVPVPERATVCGLPVALSVIVTIADRAPAAVGVKVTYTLQTEFGATAAPQLLVCAKSPAVVIPVICMGVLPLLETAITCAALVVFRS
jgi:hypothetical protein